jgi:hypothetical protein
MDVVVYGMSGLGNQLFQYAAGLYYATRYKAALRVLTNPVAEFSFGSPRPFQLDEFRVSAPVREATWFERILTTNNPKHKRVAEALGVLMNARRFKEPRQAHFHPDLPYRRLPATVYLRDYWQAAGYAEAVEERLREDLELRSQPQTKDHEVLNAIASSRCAISVHVRCSDYLKAKDPMVLPYSYYQQAWNAMLEQFKDADFFIFSDDIEFARANLPQTGKRTFVSHNNELTAYQDLRIMASCQHHIIANSSFSWWGAWLNPNASKVVIAPKYWSGTADSYFPELFPPAWRLLDNLAAN